MTQCDTAAGCTETVEAQLRRHYSSADLNTAWSFGIPQLSHMSHFGGAILFPAAIFMVYIVASEIAQVQTAASQHRMCVEVAFQEYKFNESHTDCSSKVGYYAARALLVLVHDVLIPVAFSPTITSVLAVTTSYDIVFCGAIAMVVLQADYHLFGNIMTDTRLNEMTKEFSLDLSRRQCNRLEIELTVVFWNAIFWMLFIYFVTADWTMRFVFNPDVGDPRVYMVKFFPLLTFPISSEVMIEVWCAIRESCEGVKISKMKVAARMGCGLLVKVVTFFCMCIVGFLVDVIFFNRANEMQAATGDIHSAHPVNWLSVYGVLP